MKNHINNLNNLHHGWAVALGKMKVCYIPEIVNEVWNSVGSIAWSTLNSLIRIYSQ